MQKALSDDKSKKLKHVKIYDILYNQIKEGFFPVGSSLPSEPELALQMGVSRMTLRRALALLQEDNLVENIRGKGNYIRANAMLQPNSGMEHICHPIQNCCIPPYDTVELELRLEVPTEAIAETLKVSCAAVVIVDRWYLAEGQHIAYSLSFLPIEVVSANKLDLNHPEQIQQFLEATVYEKASDSTLQLTHSTAGNFTAYKYSLSQTNSFELIHEHLYDSTHSILAYSKHYIPSASFQLHLHGTAAQRR